ncbi:MAG: hypothetical protein ASARMPREDX12_005423 [Alectoria sarmentosa]|nr:MAG: hypothetical protein ASARMPREDX12_005423 [Alectoria sarmentosa]
MSTVTPAESAAAAQTQDLPTIVLVQGSFQIPKVYANLVRGLVARGYPTIHPQLPTCSNTDSANFPQLSLVDDALAIRTELTRQIEYEGKTVVVVMHSYGGLVGSEATTSELSYAQRRAQGLPGGVVHFFFYSAFLLNEGQSVLGAFGESPNNDVKPDGRFYILHGDQTLYSDLPPSEASLWASMLIAQSYRVQTTKLTRAAWRYIPSTYLICENDHAVPPQYQEVLAASAEARVERCSSGHSPHLSQPEMLVQKIHEASLKAVAELDND